MKKKRYREISKFTLLQIPFKFMCTLAYYDRIDAWTLNMIHSSTAGCQTVWSDQKNGRKVENPADVEEFVAVLLANFQAAAATSLDALTACRRDPRKSMHTLGTHAWDVLAGFNLIALSLEGNNFMTSRMLSWRLWSTCQTWNRASLSIIIVDQASSWIQVT